MKNEVPLIVFAPSGRVVAAAGIAAPVGALLDALDVPAPLRAAAAGLRAAARPGQAARAWAELEDGPCELLCVGALPLHAAPLELGALLRSALSSLQEQAQCIGATLLLDAAPDLPSVNADADQIAWAVTTLVGNALRYVRAATRLRPGGQIEVSARREPGAVTITIVDDGPGIPEDRLSRLLTRTPGAPHAIGLSLALVQEVALAHGGSFEVSSRTRGLDHGTTVKLNLRTG
jgi:signal transduction histidine kinase